MSAAKPATVPAQIGVHEKAAGRGQDYLKGGAQAQRVMELATAASARSN